MSHPNHAIVERFIDGMSEGFFPDELLSDDFTVWIVGYNKTVDKASFVKGISAIPEVFPDKLVFTINSMTAEDDRVVAEFVCDGVSLNGKRYQNHYLYLFKIRDGQVYYLAEYLDMDAMRNVLVPEMQSLQPS